MYEEHEEEVEENTVPEVEHPTRLVFTKYRKRLLSSIAATMVNSVGFYLVLTYLPTYLTQYAGVNAGDAQLATDIALLAYIFIVLAAGKVSDINGMAPASDMMGICIIAGIILWFTAHDYNGIELHDNK